MDPYEEARRVYERWLLQMAEDAILMRKSSKRPPSPHTLAKAELDAEARRIEAPVKETLRAAEALLVGIAAAERRNDE